MPARKAVKRTTSAHPQPPTLLAGQIRSELHLCPRCWAPVVRLVDARSPEASMNCHCRHFHAFAASAATLAPRGKAPPALPSEEQEAPARRPSRARRVA